MTEHPDWTVLDPAAPPGLSELQGAGRVVGIVATEAAHGAGWGIATAVHAAEAWSAAGVRLILADGSLADPKLHDEVGIENGEGVADALTFGSSIRRVARRVEGQSYFAVAAGTAVADAAEAMAGGRWTHLCAAFRDAGVTLAVYLDAGAPATAIALQEASHVLVVTGENEPVPAVAEECGAVLIGVVGVEGGDVVSDASAVEAPEDDLSFEAPAEDDEAFETPAWAAEEAAEDLSFEAPAEEAAEDLSSEAPAEDDEDDLSFEAPAEEAAEDLSFEAPAEEAAEDLSFEAPAEDAAEDLSFEAPVEEAAEDLSSEADDEDEEDDLSFEPPAWAAEEEPSSDVAGDPLDLEPEPIPHEADAEDALPDPLHAPAAGDAEEAIFQRALQGAEREEVAHLEEILEETEGGAKGSGRRNFLILILLLVIVGVLAAGWLGYVEIPGITPTGGSAATAPPSSQPVAAPPPEETSPAQTYSVALGAFADVATAVALAEELAVDRPDLVFIVEPVAVDGQVLHRTLAGPALDSMAAAGLLATLAESAGAQASAWGLRPTPLAFELGQMPALDAAQRRASVLQGLGVPAYVLAVTYSDNVVEYRVYAGAYADEAEAAELRALLTERGVNGAHLSPRKGLLP